MSIFNQTTVNRVDVDVTIDPVRNILWGMSLLTAEKSQLIDSPWLMQTAETLTAEQQKNNRLVFQEFGDELPIVEAPDFPAYLTIIENEIIETVASDASLSRPVFDGLEGELDAYRANPEQMKVFVFEHLTEMWVRYFAQPWQKASYRLNTMVPSLRSRHWPKSSAAVAIRAFLRRDIPDNIAVLLNGVKRVVFVPSPYMHLQAARFGSADTLWVFVLADPWALPLRFEPIKRTEVLRLINALADETRLQMLELLAVDDSIRGQAFLEYLDVSQPTVSRHLKILKNSQWVTEERSGADASKLYELNRDRLESFYYLLRTLLSANNAQEVLQDVRSEFPAVLQPFLNAEGHVVSWPSKRKPQQAVLKYLADKVVQDKEYSEKELTELLASWLVHADAVHMRRELVDWNYLVRTASGSHYWRDSS